jgi:hypothetical protein
MAFPFLPDKHLTCDVTTAGASFTMVTDSAHATACSMRCRVQRVDAAMTELYTGTDSSSAGSVQERLVVSVSGLPNDGHFRATLEYEEVSGSGTWVTSVSVDFYTLPSTGSLETIAYGDDHRNKTVIDNAAHARVIKNTRAMSLMIADKRHFAAHLGDLDFAPGNALSSQQDAYDYGLAIRNSDEALTEEMWRWKVDGNHWARDGGGGDQDTWKENMALQFLKNPSADDADEQYGKIECGPALCLFATPYTESGFSPATPADWDLPSAVWTFIETELSNNTSPWVNIYLHQLLGGATTTGTGAYGWGGGEKILAAGTAMVTLHDLLRQYRPDAGVLVFTGHTHIAEHAVYDGIHYLNPGSTTAPFAARITEEHGYLLSDGSQAPVSGCLSAGYQYIEVSQSLTAATVRFREIYAKDGSTEVNRVIHEFTARRPQPALRAAGLSRRRVA